MDDDEDFGYGDWYIVGCEVHCIPCTLYDDLSVGVTNNSPGFLALEKWDWHGRNAFGNFADLRANTPMLVPQQIAFRRSPCFNNFGVECPFGSSCNCDLKHLDSLYDPGPQDPGCRDGTEYGQLRRDWLPEWWFFVGHHLQEAPFWMHCRKEKNPPQIHAIRTYGYSGRGSVYQMLSFRRGYCVINFNVMLFGATVGDSRCAWADTHYYNDLSRWRWARWYVPSISVSIAVPGNASPQMRAELAVQNAALEWAEEDRQKHFKGRLHFDQVEKSQFVRPNRNLTMWNRGPTLFNDPDEPPPVLMTLDRCHMKWATTEGKEGEIVPVPVSVDIVIVGGHLKFDCSMLKIMERRNPLPGDDVYNYRLRPSARVDLTLLLGVRATEQAPIVAKRPWLDDGDMQLNIENATGASQGFPRVCPRVDGQILDEIVYVYADAQGNETRFTPPSEVTWLGSAQQITAPHAQMEDRWAGLPHDYWYDEDDNNSSHTINDICLRTADFFRVTDPLWVYGMPDTYNEDGTAGEIHRNLGKVGFYIAHDPAEQAVA
jgi:hypothetical protein